jgi:hypothetical protein
MPACCACTCRYCGKCGFYKSRQIPSLLQSGNANCCGHAEWVCMYASCCGHAEWVCTMLWSCRVGLRHAADMQSGFALSCVHAEWVCNMLWSCKVGLQHAADVQSGGATCCNMLEVDHTINITHYWGWPEPYIYIYIRCIYGIIGRGITNLIYTVIYSVYIYGYGQPYT